MTWLLAGLLLLHAAVYFGWRKFYARMPRISAYPLETLPEHPPLVSVLVPARNERDCLEECLHGLLAQDYPGYEIIVANDNSTDDTPAILDRMAAEARARGIALKPIHLMHHPEGWAGKNFALDQAFQQARGEYLLCVDADTAPHPAMLRQAMATVLRERVDLLTIVPSPVMRSFWDRVANGFILMMAIFVDLDKINDPATKAVNANGPFMLFSRKAYEAIGGHAAIASEIWEDAILAERIKFGGHRLRYAFAPELMRVKLYLNLRELLDGWAKISYRKLQLKRSNPVGDVLTALAIVMIWVAPWLAGAWLSLSPIAGVTPNLPNLFLALGSCGMIVGSVRLVERFLKVEGGLSPLLNALGAVMTAYLLVRTVWRFVTGRGATWKGSQYEAARKG